MKWFLNLLLGLIKLCFKLLRYLIPAALVLYIIDWVMADVPFRGPLILAGIFLWFLLLEGLRRTFLRLRLHFMDGYAFEAYCLKRLKKNGFYDVESTTGSRDHGADILARRGMNRYAFQCKKYQYPVGNKAVQQAFSAMNYYDCDKAVVIANQRFTSQAEAEAEKLGVELWDKKVLMDL